MKYQQLQFIPPTLIDIPKAKEHQKASSKHRDSKQYLPIIVVLRGLASLAVCMFHFTKGFVEEEGLIRGIFRNGWMGVEVFFVISGFVIPFSLLGSSFRIGHYWRFLKKRFLRIEPAYIVSIFLILFLNYLASKTPGFAGDSFKINVMELLEHLGYLVNLFGNTWLSPVYWTLEIEFHYYLIIGVLIALWNLNNRWIILSTVLLLLSLSFLSQDVIQFFKYTDIFVIGITTAFYKKQYLSRPLYVLLLIVGTLIIFENHGLAIATLTSVTALLIGFFGSYGNSKVLLFLGNISYSLYLVHVPIGGKIINLSKRMDLSESLKFGVIILALLISIYVAWIFYKFIEKPSHQWAKKVKFN